MIAMKITVQGRVQGVGFRYFTYGRARHHGLTGYVRNQADGSVEIVADVRSWPRSRHLPGQSLACCRGRVAPMDGFKGGFVDPRRNTPNFGPYLYGKTDLPTR